MLLFLDFDGVMHAVRCGVDRYFCHLGLLEGWLRRRPGVEVVISSSWRAVHPFDEMQGYFSRDLQARIVGVTPLLEGNNDLLREREISAWLESTGRTAAPWAALDDMPEFFSPLQPRLVLCDGAVGLTSDSLQQLDRVLDLVE